jgi:hypothetical protein
LYFLFNSEQESDLHGPFENLLKYGTKEDILDQIEVLVGKALEGSFTYQKNLSFGSAEDFPSLLGMFSRATFFL